MMTGDRGIHFWIFIGILVFLHFTARLVLGWGDLSPDLGVIALLLLSRGVGAGASAGWGFGLGLMQDAVTGVAVGAGALAGSLTGWASSRSREMFVGDSLGFTALYLFFGKWAHDALLAIAAGGAAGGWAPVLAIAPLQAAYATAAGIALLVLYRTLTE